MTAFSCCEETLFGTLDEAPGRTGLLIVSGGNEVRIGAHRGMSLLAQRLAERGTPVFRFDRRGIGDSTGVNAGFLSAEPDIAAAAATFAAMTGIERIVALGNCDAATALALFGDRVGLDALVLANPWTVEEQSDLPPAAAIRARYAAKVRDPREWWRLMRGRVRIGSVLKGLAKITVKQTELPDGLADRLTKCLAAARLPVTILLAKRDNTAIAFRAACHARLPTTVAIRELDTDSHSFATTTDKQWLFEQVTTALSSVG